MGPRLNQTINKKRKSSRAGDTGQSCIPKYNTCLIRRRTSVQSRSHIKKLDMILYNCNPSAGEAELGGSCGWLVSQSCLDLQVYNPIRKQMAILKTFSPLFYPWAHLTRRPVLQHAESSAAEGHWCLFSPGDLHSTSWHYENQQPARRKFSG